MISDILERSRDEKKFISIWLYEEEDEFWCGYVKDFTDELVFLQHFTEYGKPDGILIEAIENIESIDFEDDYSRSIEYLVKHHAEIDKETDFKFELSNADNWRYEILDELVADRARVVRIQVNGDAFYSGLVEWLDDEHVVLKLIGKIGQDQGKSLFKLEDINSIRINDIENRKKLLLYNWKNKSKNS